MKIILYITRTQEKKVVLILWMMWHLNQDLKNRKDGELRRLELQTRRNGFCNDTAGSGSYM